MWAVVPVLCPRFGHGYKRQMLHFHMPVVESGTFLWLALDSECNLGAEN